MTEPRFTQQEKALLLASRRADTEPRGHHGHPLRVATDPEIRGKLRIVGPTIDFISQALRRFQDDYAKQYGEKSITPDMLWRVELND